MFTEDNKYFVGKFSNDKAENFGVLFNSAGMYAGDFHDGEPSGKGVFVGVNGGAIVADSFNLTQNGDTFQIPKDVYLAPIQAAAPKAAPKAASARRRNVDD